MPEFDRPAFFSLPENIDRSWQAQTSQSALVELKKLQRADTRTTKQFDKEVWALELAPVLNLWKKLNQVLLY